LQIVFLKFGWRGKISIATTVNAGRYEWMKRSPGLHYRPKTSQKILHLNPVTFQDAGYYCVYMYHGNGGDLLQTYCFKLVVLGKHFKFVLYSICAKTAKLEKCVAFYK